MHSRKWLACGVYISGVHGLAMVVIQASSSKSYEDQSESVSLNSDLWECHVPLEESVLVMSMIASQTLTISSIDLCVSGFGPGNAIHLACQRFWTLIDLSIGDMHGDQVCRIFRQNYEDGRV